MAALGEYYHSKGIKYALYTAESATTCGGYPASKDHEFLDAKTFASWGVDYMKVSGPAPALPAPTARAAPPVQAFLSALSSSRRAADAGRAADHLCRSVPGPPARHRRGACTHVGGWLVPVQVDGCGGPEYYDEGYKTMGAALQASGRQIEYACSWPAYINGGNETTQQATFIKMINYGCNGWRNFDDIQCNWKSLGHIIDHWGDYGLSLQPFAGPGHWHDMECVFVFLRDFVLVFVRRYHHSSFHLSPCL
eukprot:SAG22_NODE_6548_length_841_cov_0.684636_1_plen_251_part_00